MEYLGTRVGEEQTEYTDAVLAEANTPEFPGLEDSGGQKREALPYGAASEYQGVPVERRNYSRGSTPMLIPASLPVDTGTEKKSSPEPADSFDETASGEAENEKNEVKAAEEEDTGILAGFPGGTMEDWEDPALEADSKEERDTRYEVSADNPEDARRSGISERLERDGSISYYEEKVPIELAEYLWSLYRIDRIVNKTEFSSKEDKLTALHEELSKIIPPENMQEDAALIFLPALEKTNLDLFIYTLQLINLFMPMGSAERSPTDVIFEMSRDQGEFTMDLELRNNVVTILINGYGDFHYGSREPFAFDDVIAKILPENSMLSMLMKNNRFRLTQGGTALLQGLLHIL